VAGTFKGWSEDFQPFFIGLQLDNSKRYFDANRKVYLEKVRAPMEALLAELEPEFGPGRVHRANRDTRFSTDKSPYKLNIYATADRGGYVALDAKGLTAAAGRYQMDRDQLESFRTAVIADSSGEELLAIVAELERAGYQVEGEELKRTPPGLPADHSRARLLRHRRVFFWRNFGLHPWLGTAQTKEKIAEVWRAGRPLDAWLDRVLG
jgi:uncharacterized protein (TIGR02453 family)